MSQHITLLHAQGEFFLDCTTSQALPAAGTIAHISHESRACLAVNPAAVTGTPTLLVLYRPLGESTWEPTGVSVTLDGTGLQKGDVSELPAAMIGFVELAVWGAGTGGDVIPLSAALIVVD